MDYIEDNPAFTKPTLQDFKSATIHPDCANLLFDDDELEYGLDMHSYISEKHKEIVDFVDKNPDLFKSNTDVLSWVVINMSIAQKHEILEIYFEKVIAIDILKRVYRNNGLDLYINDISKLEAPIEKDPFLQNLDKFLKESLSNKKENFYEYEPDIDTYSQTDIPDSIQCKAITQLFFDTTAVLDDDMLLYGYICG